MRSWYIYILVSLSMLFWGMSFVWTSIVFEYYKPITTVFIRLVISSAIIFAGLKIFNRSEKIKREDYKLFLISSLFNPFLYFVGESFGLKYSSSTISSVIIATIPVFTPMVGYYVLNERLSRINIVGLIISFLGVVIMLVNRDLSLNADPKGVLLLFVAVGSAVSYSVLLKKLTLKYSAFTIIGVQNMIGAIYFLPLFIYFDLGHFLSVVPDTRLILALLQLILFASILAFVFYIMTTSALGISKTNVFTNVIPGVTAIASYFILSEFFNINKVIGIVIVVLGVFLSQINKSYKVINIYRYFWRINNKS